MCHIANVRIASVTGNRLLSSGFSVFERAPRIVSHIDSQRVDRQLRLSFSMNAREWFSTGPHIGSIALNTIGGTRRPSHITELGLETDVSHSLMRPARWLFTDSTGTGQSKRLFREHGLRHTGQGRRREGRALNHTALYAAAVHIGYHVDIFTFFHPICYLFSLLMPSTHYAPHSLSKTYHNLHSYTFPGLEAMVCVQSETAIEIFSGRPDPNPA